MSRAEIDVLAERQRQIHAEGFDEAHDEDEYHENGELAIAAACYCMGPGQVRAHGNRTPAETDAIVWPWGPKWWKPSTRRRDLVKAAALIIAEIDRLDRVAASGE